MKKFVLVAAACTAALCVSTTSFARMAPANDKKAMMRMHKVEAKAAKKEVRTLRQIIGRRAIQARERARQTDMRAKDMLKKQKDMWSSSKAWSSAASSTWSSSAAMSSAASSWSSSAAAASSAWSSAASSAQ